jgi:rare lipoprotein A
MHYELVEPSGSQFSRKSSKKSAQISTIWTAFAGAMLVLLCALFTANNCYAAGNQFNKIPTSDLNPSFNLRLESPNFLLAAGDEFGRSAAHDTAASATLDEIEKYLGAAAIPLIGAASWYNPFVSDSSEAESLETETASGDQYDPDKWTAAIQIDLRAWFGGVGFGKDYATAYALVEYGDKQEIVKINDVGPLKPGRLIDLSERAMRYFDPSLETGLLGAVKITPLLGDRWKAGPLTRERIPSRWVGPSLDDAVV